eukprot:11007226-Heterocapsa_arctica.AAC.1
MPTGKYRKGDWTCGGCRHSNFGKNKKENRWCRKCGQSISEGFHAFGDHTLNAAKQQWFLTPRN